MERAGLAAEEALGQIDGVPQIEVADLWALDADDAKDVPRRRIESASFARWNDRLADLCHACSRVVVERGVVGRQQVDRIDDDRLCRATRGGVGRRFDGR